MSVVIDSDKDQLIAIWRAAKKLADSEIPAASLFAKRLLVETGTILDQLMIPTPDEIETT